MFGYYVKELEEKIDELEDTLSLKEREKEYCKEEIDSVNKYLTSKEDIHFNKIMSSIVSFLIIAIFFIACSLSSFSFLFSVVFKVGALISSILLVKNVYKGIIKESKKLKSAYSDYLKLSNIEIEAMLDNLKQKEENLIKEVNNISNDLDTYYVELGVIKDCKSDLENSVNVPYLQADSKEEYKVFTALKGDNLKVLSEFLIDSREYSGYDYDLNSGYKVRTKQFIKKM